MLALCMVLGRRRAVFCDSTGLDTRKSFLKEFAKRMFFSRCDGFLCYGERSREYVSSYGVPASKIYYRCQAAALPHGYDPALVQGNYAAQAQPAGEAPHFLFLGRLSVEKGLHDLLEAFSLVHARFNGARLCLVGAGPQEAALREQISRLGLQDAVELPGPRTLEQVVPLFYRSVALVLPSYREPWGLVVNESLSYGCPVVVSDRCGCVPELVIEGVTGYAIPAGNVAKLSGAMLAAVALSADRAATAARCLKVMSAFTPESAAEEILRGCREIVAARA
jgi:glycosyltransferase involved in cell wall biosynthesis